MEPLLLLHGAIGAKDQLRNLADCLKAKFEVHTLDFSGHGGSDFPAESFSISLFANDVLQYLREKKIESISIFGYSMGGYVAMYLARHYPQMVQKIITLATKFYWDEEVAAKEIRMLNSETIMEKLPAFAKQLEKRHSPNDWKMVLEKTKEMLINLGSNNSLKLPDYSQISAPCLLLLGDKDRMVTREETIEVAGTLKNVKFRILENTPHPIEQVNEIFLASVIRNFLEKRVD